MHGVVVRELAKLTYFAHVEEARLHTLFGVIVHWQGIVKVNTQVLYSSYV